MNNHCNIVLIGPMGAGKTSIGKALARTIDWEFYDSDQVIEERSGVELLWIYDLEGEVGFQHREQKVISELTKKNHIVLATGGSTVNILENRKAIKRNSLVIYLSASINDQLIRTGYGKGKRPLSSAIEERKIVLQNLHTKYTHFYEELADITYITDGKITNKILNDLINLINEENPSIFLK